MSTAQGSVRGGHAARRRPFRFAATYVALVVFAGLLAFVLYGPKPKEKAVVPSQAAKVMSFSRESLTELTIRGKDPAIRLRKDATGRWAMFEPRSLPADQSRMTGLSYALSDLMAERKVVDRAAKPADFGLEKPDYTVELGFQDGTRRTLLIGSKAPVGSAYYVKDAAAEPVYVVSTYALENLFGKPFDFMQKNVADFLVSEVERARFAAGSEAFEVRREQAKDKDGKEKEVWRLYRDAAAGQPAPAPVELEGGASEALSALRALKASDLPVEGGLTAQAGAGAAAWRAEVHLKGKAEPLRVEFAVAGEKAYAQRAGDPLVYPLPAKDVNEAQAKWKELGNKR